MITLARAIGQARRDGARRRGGAAAVCMWYAGAGPGSVGSVAEAHAQYTHGAVWFRGGSWCARARRLSGPAPLARWPEESSSGQVPRGGGLKSRAL